MKNRRDFLKYVAISGLYSLGGFSKLQAASFQDYKAIVVLYLGGGNDGLNTFIPSSSDQKSGYGNYASIRDNIRVKENPLTLVVNDGKLDLSGKNPYADNDSLKESYTKGFYLHDGLDVATNALMPEIAHLINQKKVAIVANCGNLISPATKRELLEKKKPLPPFLYAHNHQTKLALNGLAGKLDFTGWGGRIYDRWRDINPKTIYGMNIAISRTTHLFDGVYTQPLVINAGGPTKYAHIKRELYDDYLLSHREDIFKKLYNRYRRHSFEMQEKISSDWENAQDFSSLKNAYGETLFSMPSNETLSQSSPTLASGNLLRDFKAVAKLAKIGKDEGINREIFHIYDGGYDTHNNQTQQHAKKLRGLSLGVGDFYRALESMGMQNEVTLVVISEFGRSTGNNADGTDHAWGGNYFVVGGGVKGGLYGRMPDLTLGGEDDLTKKGRLIPTTSFTQLYATVVKWFGADEVMLLQIFPELANFQMKDLGFMG